MEVGEKKDIDVTFPENYYENLAGKKVVFEITVQKLYKEVKQELELISFFFCYGFIYNYLI